MKSNLKPLGIASAVAVASAGYAGVASAQSVANNSLGDLALVPYYTVQGDWLTGIHIVNTSEHTQVVKFRFRRAADSLDALDFNVIMSPQDVYAGFLSDDENGNISWQADDTSCTAPVTTSGKLTMPDVYRDGAETGYVEIIAMAQPVSETQGIAVAAKHSDGVPLDCEAVRSNFKRDGTSVDDPGHVHSALTWQEASAVPGGPAGGPQEYDNSVNALKVSYFIRDNATGIEFGDNAVHIQDFLGEPQMSNQVTGYRDGDLEGFDFPDLNGGVPTGTDGNGDGSERGKFVSLRAGNVLGVAELINEWTANTANGAALDWVVTMPGQYTMFDRIQYIATLDDDDEECLRGSGDGVIGCDNRDIPVEAVITPYNREEGTTTTPEEDLVVSPQRPGEIDRVQLPNEVNVIAFGETQSVLGVVDRRINASLGQPFGWLSLAVNSADTYLSGESAVCDFDPTQDTDTPNEAAGDALDFSCSAVSGNVPMIGFAAWARQVAANPDASYGRIVSHSFVGGS